MELDLSQWTLASASSHSSSSDESSLQSTSIMLDQESLTQSGILDGTEILNGFRSFGNTGSHLPIDIVDVPPPAARPQQPATISPFRNITNSTIDSYSMNQNGETSDLNTMEQQLKNLAKGIKNHGTVIGNFDEEELALRERALKSVPRNIENLTRIWWITFFLLF
jgi:hypothetical protein